MNAIAACKKALHIITHKNIRNEKNSKMTRAITAGAQIPFMFFALLVLVISASP